MGPHANAEILRAGAPLQEANAALILVHGRGATADGMLGLADALEVGPDFAVLAPQAVNHTWYPERFLAPFFENEPWLSSALALLTRIAEEVEAAGISAERTFLAGFSQGACLTADWAARNARRYGGVLVFSGGLIGPPGTRWEFPGSLDGTPVFIGASDADPHIPLVRVEETARVLETMGAEVTARIYRGTAHTINADEIEHARQILQRVG